MKIGIIVGSTRDNRFGIHVARWVMEQAAQRTEATYELVDLAEFDLPLLTSAVQPAALGKSYPDERVQRWSDKIDELDGYIVVTPEYNHSIPAALKNSFDVLGTEWQQKAIALVGYGYSNGVRAIEHLRGVVANFSMYAIRNALEFNLPAEMDENGLVPNERRATEAQALFASLEAATKAMNTLR